MVRCIPSALSLAPSALALSAQISLYPIGPLSQSPPPPKPLLCSPPEGVPKARKILLVAPRNSSNPFIFPPIPSSLLLRPSPNTAFSSFSHSLATHQTCRLARESRTRRRSSRLSLLTSPDRRKSKANCLHFDVMCLPDASEILFLCQLQRSSLGHPLNLFGRAPIDLVSPISEASIFTEWAV